MFIWPGGVWATAVPHVRTNTNASAFTRLPRQEARRIGVFPSVNSRVIASVYCRDRACGDASEDSLTKTSGSRQLPIAISAMVASAGTPRRFDVSVRPLGHDADGPAAGHALRKEAVETDRLVKRHDAADANGASQ
jgi:hypothetical protein